MEDSPLQTLTSSNTRDKPSSAWLEEVRSLLDDLFREIERTYETLREDESRWQDRTDTYSKKERDEKNEGALNIARNMTQNLDQIYSTALQIKSLLDTSLEEELPTQTHSADTYVEFMEAIKSANDFMSSTTHTPNGGSSLNILGQIPDVSDGRQPIKYSKSKTNVLDPISGVLDGFAYSESKTIMGSQEEQGSRSLYTADKDDSITTRKRSYERDSLNRLQVEGFSKSEAKNEKSNTNQQNSLKSGKSDNYSRNGTNNEESSTNQGISYGLGEEGSSAGNAQDKKSNGKNKDGAGSTKGKDSLEKSSTSFSSETFSELFTDPDNPSSGARKKSKTNGRQTNHQTKNRYDKQFLDDLENYDNEEGFNLQQYVSELKRVHFREPNTKQTKQFQENQKTYFDFDDYFQKIRCLHYKYNSLKETLDENNNE